MSEQRSLFSYLPNVILFLAVIGVFYLALLRVDQYLKQSAIDNCAQFARQEQADPKTGSKSIYPISELYETCLDRKGVK